MQDNVINEISVNVKRIAPGSAQAVCRAISTTLPEWFAIPEANLNYEQGMLSRISFAAYEKDEVVGLITLEIQYDNNAIIYWLGVKKDLHGKGVGRKLLQAAENFCLENGCHSLTVETLSPQQNDLHYLQTYQFYLKAGFWPLFEVVVHDHLMVFLQKTISLNNYEFIDLTHTLSPEIPHWGIDVGFKYNARLIQSAEAGPIKFRVQRLEMSSGIGTHIDAPSHCYEDKAAIHNLPLEFLISPCCVINVAKKADAVYSVNVNDILAFEAKYGTIPEKSFVIIYTGWSQKWDHPEQYRNEKVFPNLSPNAAEFLLTRKINGLGIDTLSPDAFGSDFPVHQIFLSAGKYIVENVAHADRLDPVGNYSFALPIKVKDGTEAPMRLIGMKPKKYQS